MDLNFRKSVRKMLFLGENFFSLFVILNHWYKDKFISKTVTVQHKCYVTLKYIRYSLNKSGVFYNG